LEREKVEALLYVEFKGSEEKRTATDLKALIQSDGKRYAAVLDEIKAEATYTRVYEKLMCVKKQAALRTAF
jgi:hypothetical protein